MNKLEIKLANGHTLTAELCDYGGEIPPEIAVYIKDKDGAVVQDVTLVRAKQIKPAIPDNESVGAEVLIWGDENYEDYTHKFVFTIEERNQTEE